MIFDIAAGVLGDFVLSSLFERRSRRRRAKRLKAGGDLECSVRVSEGTYRGLTGKWTAGHAVLRPGSMIFNGIPIPVQDVTTKNHRRAHGGEIFSVNPECNILTVTTTSAVLEWALLPEQQDEAVRRVS